MKQMIIKYIPIWVIYKIRYIVEYLHGYFETRKMHGCDKDNKRKIVIIDLPEHGNLGDQAIALSEIDFLEKCFNPENDELYFWYLEDFVRHWLWMKKKLKRDDVILCHGGGNIGDVYVRAEYIRQIVIHEFPNNRIIILPQTCYFSNSTFGNIIKKRSEQIYNSHSNLTICAREETTYELCKNIFSKNNILLVPDMVLSYQYNKRKSVEKRKKNHVVLFCMRNDCEKVISVEQQKAFERKCKEKGFTIKWTDTIYNGNIKDISEAKEKVDEKIFEFSKCDLVVTDRLHGMVFTAISGSRGLIIHNHNHKVYGVYKWIESLCNITFLERESDFEEKIAELMKYDNTAIGFPDLSDEFCLLKDTIFGVV